MKTNSALNWGVKTLVVLAACASASVFAADSSTSTATAESVTPSLKDKISVKYLGILAGPTVRGVSEGAVTQQADGSKIFLFNRMGIAYKMNKQFDAGITSEFDVTADPKAKGRDIYLRTGNSNWLTAGNLKVSGDFFRAYLPTSNKAHNTHRMFGLRFYPVVEYQVGSSRWSITSLQYIQKNVHSQAAGGDQMFAEWVPILNYQLNPKVALYGAFDGLVKNKQGASLTDWTDSGENEWDLGASIDVSPKINVSPYLALPANMEAKRNLGTLSINVSVSAKLL